MIFHGNAAAVIQVLTLVVTAERIAVRLVQAYKQRNGK